MIRELRVSQDDSVALAIAKRAAREAIRWKISAASEATNRAEGTPRQTVQLQEAAEIHLRVTYQKSPIRNRS
jgi:hypothetical protein